MENRIRDLFPEMDRNYTKFAPDNNIDSDCSLQCL